MEGTEGTERGSTCENGESVTLLQHEYWMRLALQQADVSAQRGDVPVGCVIVDSSGKVVGTGNNQRELLQDPTAHAEIVAMRHASWRTGHWRLETCTLYVTLEPCAMCAGAIVNARIPRLVFGCRDPKAGAVVSLMQVVTDRRLNHRAEVIEGILTQQCAQRLQAFFAQLRTMGKK